MQFLHCFLLYFITSKTCTEILISCSQNVLHWVHMDFITNCAMTISACSLHVCQCLYFWLSERITGLVPGDFQVSVWCRQPMKSREERYSRLSPSKAKALSCLPPRLKHYLTVKLHSYLVNTVYLKTAHEEVHVSSSYFLLNLSASQVITSLL